MKKISVHEAVGHVLCHDITQIIPGKIKDRAFKKGHVVREEDIPVLLSLGKDNLYVWENKEGYLHEDDAAQRLSKMSAGAGIDFSEVKEGKINFIAKYDGLLKIDTNMLYEVNKLEEIMLATRHNNTPVKKGDKLAGTRVIPLVIDEKKIIEAESIAKNTFIEVVPYKKLKVGVVTTGNEVYYGRIEDKFGPVIKEKIESYGSEVIEQRIVNDDSDVIAKNIEELMDKGADMIVCTGGMSVDPDDTTPTGIKKVGGEIISYGAPVLPGAMFLISYKGDTPILGLPGCVMYAKTTVFDLVLPRVLIGERIKKEDLAAYGHGGLCLECDVCTYPACSFGKGW
ncbi:molybdopterin-binding protein [Anaeromicrobium sediminis]|uniref:Molybdopterin molybdenumtransferase n=1 Tax=Anaeromicrobium sediminis TaxID=1478221 RepID=A0A267MDC6_9FIRM|nr:molybdopterin-binding protein [Anaeromicrobium sediminis]PAB56813.1 molybdopterin-binding protein [Anaeromicrobium sediminis]